MKVQVQAVEVQWVDVKLVAQAQHVEGQLVPHARLKIVFLKNRVRLLYMHDRIGCYLFLSLLKKSLMQ